MTATVAARRPPIGLAVSARAAVRRLAAISLAAAVSGVLVGGVGGRLAMLLLARLNPEVSGRLSDDGFVMGRFTVVATLNLMVAALFLAMVGALTYAVLRGLMIGPRWFQLSAVGVGAGVVVGAAIVHTDGLDFVALQPTWLAIGLFVVVPGLYAVVLSVLAERWLADGSWFSRLPQWVALLPLVLLVVVMPLIPVLVFVWLVAQAVRLTEAGGRLLDGPAAGWAGRAVVTAVFAFGLQDLVSDVVVLV